MIKSAHFENIGCIRELKLTLSPLTVFVGPNSSGKSTILKAFSPSRLSASFSTWQHQSGNNVGTFEKTDRAKLYYNVSAEYIEGIAPSYQLIRLNLSSLRQPNTLQAASMLAEDGSNLANVMGTLGRRVQDDLAQQLCRLVPMFSDVDVMPVAQGKHEVRFQDRWKQNIWYRPDEVSDGTMLMLAFLVLQYQPTPVELLAIEEPERGLHPYLVGELIALLRGFATGKIGPKPIQVLIATHSAELLDFVQPDEVRFLGRNPDDGSVMVSQVDTSEPGWEQAFKEYRESLGQAWLSGGLGGVPGI